MSKVNRLALFLMLLTVSIAHRECIHDTLDVKLNFIDDTPLESSSSDRILATYQNIRIYVDFTYLTDGNSVIREYIKNQLMTAAVSYFQNTLQVVPFPSNLKFTATCGGLTPPPYLQSTGVAADLVIMVTAATSTDSYLAYAIPCSLATSNNRPIFGMINFNLRTLYTASDVDLQENLITTLHEMIHVLGFSDSLFKYYIDPTTNNKITAVGTTTVNGISTKYIALPSVVTKLRAHFDCNTLEGGYLENQGDAGSAGSHWERKMFANEFMTASSIADSVISPFTLAVLEGSGWYKLNTNSDNSEPFSWGKGKKCPFLKSPCLSGSTLSGTPEFCGTLQQEGCTFTHRAVGVCGTTNALKTDGALSSSMNYWNNNTVVLDSFSDNCPYFIGYPNLDCENPAFKANAVLSQEIYGTNSRCLSGTLTTKSTVKPLTGYCFAVKCGVSGGVTTLDVTVGSQTIPCTTQGGVSVSGLNGQLNCPDPKTFCDKANPVYCERGCSGKGTCTNGVCQCSLGWGGSDCGFRIYVDACSRCSDQQELTSCFGDGCACNPKSGICKGPALIGVGDGGVNRVNDGNAANANIISVMTSSGLITGIIMVLLMAF